MATTDRTFQEDAYRAADAIIAELDAPLSSATPELTRTMIAYAWLLGSRVGGEEVLRLLETELANLQPPEKVT